MATIDWRPKFEVFVPLGDSFILGSSILGGTDVLGYPDTNIGRWVEVSNCEVMEIEIRQGFLGTTPFDAYDPGSASIKLKGLTYAGSRKVIFVGVQVRLSVYRSPVVAPFNELYTDQYVTFDGLPLSIDIFTGYVSDISEDHLEEVEGQRGVVTIDCVDEYSKVVKARGVNMTAPTVQDVYDWLATKVKMTNSLGADASTVLSFFKGEEESHASVLRADNSIHGAMWVKDGRVNWAGKSIWTYGAPVVKISNIHTGTHLCYKNFDWTMRLSNVVNQINQKNVTATDDEEFSHLNNTSIYLYGVSAMNVDTSISNWDAQQYLDIASAPVLRVQRVTVELNSMNLHLLPGVMDTIEFTYREGTTTTTELRKVAEKTIRMTPTEWESELTFFEWTLGDPESDPVIVLREEATV